MSKRSKDLFHLLEQREREVRTEVTDTSPSRRVATRTPGTVADRLRQWLGGQPATRKRGRSPAGSTPAAAPIGLVLAAVALLCLGTGFALGRFLPRGADAATLNARTGDEPRRPGPVAPPAVDPQTASQPAPAPTAGELPAEKEEEKLSNRFYLLLQSPDRQEAANAAAYLRAHEVDTARVRRFKDGNRIVSFVAVYATDQMPVADLLARLRKVEASSRWPNLATEIAGLKPENINRYDSSKK